MQIAIPELEQVIKRLENIERMLIEQSKAQKPTVRETNTWMRRLDLMHMLHIGSEKFNEMVESERIEVLRGFGPRSNRYRMIQ
jgi:hypothetical protein